ncbi:hypothetical protein C7T94_03045 [Pedobacter yulinensis]|uniref:Uncharacterized protein n=1 Tax=Pedobacter yulinensis TaxID=2126353 RepID=A0A2T3HRL9_9SPHI|nr:hypothetical protein [Pedobacter yulinensis]PST85104.1 hypothetical protein C7T94_03045 [Pedobacter yulinensis]
MKAFIRSGVLAVLLLCNLFAGGQELYVYTEPASNMPAKSVGLRLSYERMDDLDFSSRLVPEAMVGINRNLMVHAQAFLSDMEGPFAFEGASFYAKYRFLSIDDLQKHFRMAAYGRISSSRRPFHSEDINLEGDNSGYQAGLVATQLLHKLALSVTTGYARVFKNDEKIRPHTAAPAGMLNYSLSAGYLLFPRVYRDYRQPNFNLYAEVLGKTNPGTGHSYLDIAPAVQLILNSQLRIDVGYRFQATGNIENRYLRNMFLARVEYNIFNVIK